MLKTFMHAVMALSLAFGVAVSTTSEAEAHGRYRGGGVGLGIAAGIIGLGILGASAHARGYPYRSYSSYDRECFRGRRECHWSGRRCFENRWGDTVCRGGRYVCERPLICD